MESRMVPEHPTESFSNVAFPQDQLVCVDTEAKDTMIESKSAVSSGTIFGAKSSLESFVGALNYDGYQNAVSNAYPSDSAPNEEQDALSVSSAESVAQPLTFACVPNLEASVTKKPAMSDATMESNAVCFDPSSAISSTEDQHPLKMILCSLCKNHSNALPLSVSVDIKGDNMPNALLVPCISVPESVSTAEAVDFPSSCINIENTTSNCLASSSAGLPFTESICTSSMQATFSDDDSDPTCTTEQKNSKLELLAERLTGAPLMSAGNEIDFHMQSGSKKSWLVPATAILPSSAPLTFRASMASGSAKRKSAFSKKFAKEHSTLLTNSVPSISTESMLSNQQPGRALEVGHHPCGNADYTNSLRPVTSKQQFLSQNSLPSSAHSHQREVVPTMDLNKLNPAASGYSELNGALPNSLGGTSKTVSLKAEATLSDLPASPSSSFSEQCHATTILAMTGRDKLQSHGSVLDSSLKSSVCHTTCFSAESKLGATEKPTDFAPNLEKKQVLSNCLVEAKSILDCGIGVDGRKYYQVLWLRHSWENESQIVDSMKDLLDTYWTVTGAEAKRHLDAIQQNVSASEFQKRPDISRRSDQVLDKNSSCLSDANALAAAAPVILYRVSKELREKTRLGSETSSGGFDLDRGSVTSIEGQLPSKSVRMSGSKVSIDRGRKPKLCERPPKEFNLAANILPPSQPVVASALVKDITKTEKKISCQICQRTFGNERSFRRHKEYYSRTHRCPICFDVLCSSRLLQQHLRLHLRKLCCRHSFQLSSCVTGVRTGTVARRIRKRKLARPKTDVRISNFKCGTCERAFLHIWDLQRHKTRAHVDSDRRLYDCDRCKKRFRSVLNLGLHKELHQDVKIKCGGCGVRFASENDFDGHDCTAWRSLVYTCVHGDLPYRKLSSVPAFRGERSREKCEKCGKNLYTKLARTVHKCQTLQRWSPCFACIFGFRSKSELSKHERFHQGTGRHKTERLNQGVLVATGKKPFRCIFCRAIYRNSRKLRGHVHACLTGLQGGDVPGSSSLSARCRLLEDFHNNHDGYIHEDKTILPDLSADQSKSFDEAIMVHRLIEELVSCVAASLDCLPLDAFAPANLESLLADDVLEREVGSVLFELTQEVGRRCNFLLNSSEDDRHAGAGEEREPSATSSPASLLFADSRPVATDDGSFDCHHQSAVLETVESMVDVISKRSALAVEISAVLARIPRRKIVYKCKICCRLFPQKFLLLSHLQKHLNTNAQACCSKCGLSGYSRRYLRKCIRDARATIRRRFSCFLCASLGRNKEETFSLKYLVQHFASHKSKMKCWTYSPVTLFDGEAGKAVVLWFRLADKALFQDGVTCEVPQFGYFYVALLSDRSSPSLFVEKQLDFRIPDPESQTSVVAQAYFTAAISDSERNKLLAPANKRVSLTLVAWKRSILPSSALASPAGEGTSTTSNIPATRCLSSMHDGLQSDVVMGREVSTVTGNALCVPSWIVMHRSCNRSRETASGAGGVVDDSDDIRQRFDCWQVSLDSGIRCCKCRTLLHSEHQMILHFYEQHSERTTRLAVCHLCSTAFKHPADMDEHIQKTHAQCELCRDHFPDAFAKEMHNSSAHKNIVYFCPDCAGPFLSPGLFLRHRRLVHDDAGKSDGDLISSAIEQAPDFDCKVCSVRVTDLCNHFHLHPSVSMIECYICAETFASQYLFARHLNLVHRMPWTARETFLMNDWVSGTLQNVLENILHGASLGMDEREDGTAKGVECDGCRLRFASPKTLEFHASQICSKSLLVCSYCDLHFFDEVDLGSHITQEHGSVESLQRKAIVLGDKDVISSIGSAVDSLCMRSAPCSSSQPTSLGLEVLGNEDGHEMEVSSSRNCPGNASDDSMLKDLEPVKQHTRTGEQLASSEITNENLPVIQASVEKARDARAASSFVECYYCAMLADSSPTLLSHYRDAHCLGASEIAALPARNLVEHRPVPDPKLCKNCKKQFALDRSLWRHMFEHLRVEIHKCFICRKTFARSFDLKRHISQEHNVLFCDYCYKGFHCFIDYERHVRLHVLELNIPRDISGKMIVELDSYSDNHEDIPLPPSDINTHVPKKIPRNVVEDERLFHCIVCDKNVEGELTFIVHMKTHAEPRRLTCVVCLKTFGEIENLRIHLQNHLMRPRSGSECSSGAVDNSMFQEDSVVDETPDKCLVCSSVFDSRDDLKSHESYFTALKPDNERKIFEQAERIAEQLFVYEMLKKAPHSRPGRGDFDVRECVVGRWEAEWRIADELGLEKLHKLRVEVLAKETLEKLKGLKSKESGSLRLKRKSKIEKLACPFCQAEQLFQDRDSFERHFLKVHACAYCHVPFADDAQLKMHTSSHLTGFSAESKFLVCLYCCKARPKQGFLEHLMRDHRLVYFSDAHLDEAGRFRWPETSLLRSAARPELLGCVSTPLVRIVSEGKKRHEALDLASLELDANVRKKLNMQSIVLLEDAVNSCSQGKKESDSCARVVEEIIAGSSSLSCPVCAWQFPSGDELRQHVLKHVLHPSKEFVSTSREAVCVVCNNVYRKTSMKTHILVMHGKEHERHQLGLLVTKGDHSRKSSVPLPTSLSSSQGSEAVAGKSVKEYRRTISAGVLSRHGYIPTGKSHKSVAFNAEDGSGASVRSKHADVISLSAPRKMKPPSEAFGASFRLGRKPGRTVIINKRVNGARKYSSDLTKIPATQRIAKPASDPAPQLLPYPYECIICAKGFFTLTQHLSHFQTRHPLMYSLEKEKYKRQKADLSRHTEAQPSSSNDVIKPRSSQRSIEKVSRKESRDLDFPGLPRARGRPRLSSSLATKRRGGHSKGDDHSIPVTSLPQSALKQRSPSLIAEDHALADGQKRPSTDGHGSSPRKPSDRRSLTRIVASEAGSGHELHSPNVPGKLKCAHCNAMFRSQIELDSHMTVHEEKKERFFSVPYPYVCIWCARGFYTTGLLKSHMQRHHAGAYTEGVERTPIVINRAPGIEQDYERGMAKVAETLVQKPLHVPNRSKRSAVEALQEDAVAGALSSSEPKRRKLEPANNLPSREVRRVRGRRRTVSDNTAIVPRKLVESRGSIDSNVLARRKSSRANTKEKSKVDLNNRSKKTQQRGRRASESTRLGESSSSAPEDEHDSSEDELDDSRVNDDKESAEVAGLIPSESTCKYCNVVLNSEPDKRTHESKHFEKGATSMQCIYCASLIQQSSELIRHVQEVHGHDSSIKLLRSPSRHLCEKCNRYYKKKDAFMTHLRLEHSELMKIECRLCDQRFFTKGEYSEHYAATHGKSIDEDAITCLICDKTYESLELLHQHYSIIHMKKDAKLHCALCNKYFRREAEYDEHKSEYHKNDRFSCGLCMLDFEEVKQCEEHVMTHKVATDFQCLLCSFYFHSQQMLTSHVSSHEDGHELKCSICGEGFSNVALLQAHKAQHSEQKLAQTCISCDKSFASGDELLAHMQEHQIPIQKTYKCSSCDESFLNLDGIQEHMEREHQGGSSQEIRKEVDDSSRDEVNDEEAVENEVDLVDADRPEGLGSVSTMNRCDLCKEMFVHPEIFREHMLKHEQCHADGDAE